jgi:membrane protease YdiL (CAAX protease family)
MIMRTVTEALYRIFVVVWVGGLLAIGYLAAPVLFASLNDRALAGELAGRLFALVGWLGLGAGAYLSLFLIGRWRAAVVKRAVFWLVLLMLGMTAAQLFGIQPLMAQLKLEALPREVMESVLRDRFATWHGVASILYLVESLLGLWLTVWTERGLR